MQYPSDIIQDGNWGRIHRGWDLSRLVLEMDWESATGESADDLMIAQVSLTYLPRVKWCSNHGGGCDQEGEWHAEWVAMLPYYSTAKTRFTIVCKKGQGK